LHEEVAYIAYHFHWPLDELVAGLEPIAAAVDAVDD